MFLKLRQLDGCPVVVNANEIVLFRATDDRPNSTCIMVLKASPGNDRIVVYESVQDILGMIAAARAGGAA